MYKQSLGTHPGLVFILQKLHKPTFILVIIASIHTLTAYLGNTLDFYNPLAKAKALPSSAFYLKSPYMFYSYLCKNMMIKYSCHAMECIVMRCNALPLYCVIFMALCLMALFSLSPSPGPANCEMMHTSQCVRSDVSFTTDTTSLIDHVNMKWRDV